MQPKSIMLVIFSILFASPLLFAHPGHGSHENLFVALFHARTGLDYLLAGLLAVGFCGVLRKLLLRIGKDESRR